MLNIINSVSILHSKLLPNIQNQFSMLQKYTLILENVFVNIGNECFLILEIILLILICFLKC